MGERFEDVVRNAFDFLDRSVDELDQHPKYSVIHFYSAIELFVKARLIKEHWALIVARPEAADKSKFRQGDFQSVGLRDANDRLIKIAEDGLSEDELRCFDRLRQERNQMVHFAHAAQADSDGAPVEMERIVSDHAQGWLYLRRLLVGRWREHFAAHATSIESLDQRMRNQTKSLERKYLLLTDQIESAVAEGRTFSVCPSCRFMSFEVGPPVWVDVGKCLTCGFHSQAVATACISPSCQKPITLVGGWERCAECGHQYSPEQIEKILDEGEMLRPTDFSDPEDYSSAREGLNNSPTFGENRSSLQG